MVSEPATSLAQQQAQDIADETLHSSVPSGPHSSVPLINPLQSRAGGLPASLSVPTAEFSLPTDQPAAQTIHQQLSSLPASLPAPPLQQDVQPLIIKEVRGYPWPIVQMVTKATVIVRDGGESTAHLALTRANLELQFRLASRGRQKDSTILLVCGELAGRAYAIGYVNPNRRSLSIVSVYVHPQGRRKGQAAAMVEELSTRALSAYRCSKCIVTLQSCLASVRGFWAKCGFEISACTKEDSATASKGIGAAEPNRSRNVQPAASLGPIEELQGAEAAGEVAVATEATEGVGQDESFVQDGAVVRARCCELDTTVMPGTVIWQTHGHPWLGESALFERHQCLGELVAWAPECPSRGVELWLLEHAETVGGCSRPCQDQLEAHEALAAIQAAKSHGSVRGAAADACLSPLTAVVHEVEAGLVAAKRALAGETGMELPQKEAAPKAARLAAEEEARRNAVAQPRREAEQARQQKRAAHEHAAQEEAARIVAQEAALISAQEAISESMLDVPGTEAAVGAVEHEAEVEIGVEAASGEPEVEVEMDVETPSAEHEVEVEMGVEAPSVEREVEVEREAEVEMEVEAPSGEREADVGVKAPKRNRKGRELAGLKSTVSFPSEVQQRRRMQGRAHISSLDHARTHRAEAANHVQNRTATAPRVDAVPKVAVAQETRIEAALQAPKAAQDAPPDHTAAAGAPQQTTAIGGCAPSSPQPCHKRRKRKGRELAGLKSMVSFPSEVQQRRRMQGRAHISSLDSSRKPRLTEVPRNSSSAGCQLRNFESVKMKHRPSAKQVIVISDSSGDEGAEATVQVPRSEAAEELAGAEAAEEVPCSEAADELPGAEAAEELPGAEAAVEVPAKAIETTNEQAEGEPSVNCPAGSMKPSMQQREAASLAESRQGTTGEYWRLATGSATKKRNRTATSTYRDDWGGRNRVAAKPRREQAITSSSGDDEDGCVGREADTSVVYCPSKRTLDKSTGCVAGLPDTRDLLVLFENVYNNAQGRNLARNARRQTSLTSACRSLTDTCVAGLQLDGNRPQSIVIDAAGSLRKGKGISERPRFSAARRLRHYITNLQGHTKLELFEPKAGLPLEQVLCMSDDADKCYGPDLKKWPRWWQQTKCEEMPDGTLRCKPMHTIDTKGGIPSNKAYTDLGDDIRKRLKEGQKLEDVELTQKELDLINRWGWVPDKQFVVRPLTEKEASIMLGFDKDHVRVAGGIQSKRKIVGNSFNTDVVAYLLDCDDLQRLRGEPVWILSLFDGCAGAAVAWHKVQGLPQLHGYTGIEIDPSARRCVQEYFKGRKEQGLLKQYSDITNRGEDAFWSNEDGLREWVATNNIKPGRLLLVGGSPCDNIAGTNNMLPASDPNGQSGLRGTKSSLYYEFTRIYKSLEAIMREKRQQEEEMLD